MKYPLAERFFSVQGEALYSGTPMAFIRFVGCSVGKKICHACDTDFEKMDKSRGGGLFTTDDLLSWVLDREESYKHVCVTGGEPLDRNLEELILALDEVGVRTHIETSGTKFPDWLLKIREKVWICVSPKPGYLDSMIAAANEIKVILHGLGDGEGWPTLADAVKW